MFKYRIKIRPVGKEEKPRECLLEEINADGFEIRLDTMMTDMRNIPEIVSLSRVEHEISISTTFDVNVIKFKLKPLFSREYCYIRFIELEEVSV